MIDIQSIRARSCDEVPQWLPHILITFPHFSFITFRITRNPAALPHYGGVANISVTQTSPDPLLAAASRPNGSSRSAARSNTAHSRSIRYGLQTSRNHYAAHATPRGKVSTCEFPNSLRCGQRICKYEIVASTSVTDLVKKSLSLSNFVDFF